MPEGDYFMEDNNDLDLDFLNNPAPAAEDAPPNQNTTSHDAVPTESAPVPEPAQWVQPQINYPPATCKSSQIATPSHAAIESEKYRSREVTAASSRNEWATDDLIPIIEDGDEDDSHTALMATDFPPEPKNLMEFGWVNCSGWLLLEHFSLQHAIPLKINKH